MQSDTKSSYISWLPVAKALSIICIIIFHIYMGQFRYLFYQGTNVFFLLSGLAIGTSLIKRDSSLSIKWLNWGKRRLFRLYPLWLLVLVIAVIAYALKFSFINLNLSAVNPFTDFLLHLLMLHVYSSQTYYSINIAWWFQGIIIQCYLLTPLFVHLTRSKISAARPNVACLLSSFVLFY